MPRRVIAIAAVLAPDPRHGSIFFFRLMTAYILAPALVVLFALVFPHPVALLSVSLAIWIGVPATFACLVAFIILLLIVFHGRIERARLRTTIEQLTMKLLEILEKLDKVSDLRLMGAEEREELTRTIVEGAKRLRGLYASESNAAGEWATSQMHIASQNLTGLAASIYLPQEGTLPALKAKIIRYLNVLLTRHLHDLTKVDLDAPEGLVFRERALTGWGKLAVHAGIAMYLMLPIVVFAIVASVFQLHLTSLSQTLISLLYLVWVIVGFFSFSELVSPEARALFTETIKVLLGRR